MQYALAASRSAAAKIPPGIYAAKVRRTATSWTQPLQIVLQQAGDFEQILHTVRGWPRPGSALPAAGAECVVAFDHTSEPIVIGWKTPGWGHDA